MLANGVTSAQLAHLKTYLHLLTVVYEYDKTPLVILNAHNQSNQLSRGFVAVTSRSIQTQRSHGV